MSQYSLAIGKCYIQTGGKAQGAEFESCMSDLGYDVVAIRELQAEEREQAYQDAQDAASEVTDTIIDTGGDLIDTITEPLSKAADTAVLIGVLALFLILSRGR